MKYTALIWKYQGEEWALLKTTSQSRLEAVATLCALHLNRLYPGSEAHYTSNARDVARVENHPEMHKIIDRLRACEYPLPGAEIVL